jgi:hypothetical protein
MPKLAQGDYVVCKHGRDILTFSSLPEHTIVYSSPRQARDGLYIRQASDSVPFFLVYFCLVLFKHMLELSQPLT